MPDPITVNPVIEKAVLNQPDRFKPSDIVTAVWRDLDTNNPKIYVSAHLRQLARSGVIKRVKAAKAIQSGTMGDYSVQGATEAEYVVNRSIREK